MGNQTHQSTSKVEEIGSLPTGGRARDDSDAQDILSNNSTPGDTQDNGKSLTVASINRLPMELLSTIFIMYAHTPDEARYSSGLAGTLSVPSHYRPILAPGAAPYILAAVCRHWRSAALSTPELWSKFIITTSMTQIPASDLTTKLAALLRRWLELSKETPLYFICLYWDDMGRIGTVLFKHIPRWSEVCFRNISSTSFQRSMKNNLLKASNLQNLTVSNCSGLREFPIGRLPRLRSLTCPPEFFPAENIGRLDLTHLSLNGNIGTVEDVLQRLRSLTSLITLQATVISQGSHHHNPLSIQVLHTALTNLTISGHNAAMALLFSSIELPALRRFCIWRFRSCTVPYSQVHESVADFMHRHESSLSDLNIYGEDLSSDELIELLRRIPKSTKCDIMLSGVSDDSIQQLTLNPSDTSQNIAPDLTYVSLHCHQGRAEPTNPSGALLSEMILSRWRRNPSVVFSLSMQYTGENPLHDVRISKRMECGSKLQFSAPFS